MTLKPGWCSRHAGNKRNESVMGCWAGGLGRPVVFIAAVTSFLSGKVLKWSLPVLALPLQPDAPQLKRLALAQGELAQIYDEDQGLRYLACVELRAGSIRGNHYHHKKQEWIYLVAGVLDLTVKDMVTQEWVRLDLRAGDLAFIQTGIAHALRVKESGQAVEFSVARFDPGDLVPVLLET